MHTNRHIVDRLAEIRATLKALAEEEKALATEVSQAMGAADALDGDLFVAFQNITMRKGGIDEAAMRAAGIDVDAYRKASKPIVTLRTAPRVHELAA